MGGGGRSCGIRLEWEGEEGRGGWGETCMNSVMHMSWSCSAYHGHLMSLKRLSSHRLAQTGLQKANACIVSGYYSASFSGQHKID